MFSRLLVANRGEIACRIMRTCRRLGIESVAVFSDADAGARHVREADRALRIGPAPARESYLDADAILRAARDCGAEAIHPGYGFLSEKLELIDACAAAGLVFIGPHRDAIARMGSKIESKRLARAAGVDCVPGYDGDDQSDARLAAEAARLGFPLLIKASAGGGGKGLRRVDGAGDFARQLDTARAEARAAFGDERVLLERLVTRPRHLEVQLLGDRHGGLVHLFERECSVQRNYQKLVEEAPANHLAEGVRTRMFEAALALGRAIGYDSAGTVEFVLDGARGDEPYFLEMNTRLQVEHPVTELTTGIDLVECQILSALGAPLPFTQAEVRRRGWAIEARINAEDPARDFEASCGRLSAYAEPAVEGLRVDSGVDGASEVTPHYDSMLAKLVGHGASREVALARLRAGLRGLRLEGVVTNQGLLGDVLDVPAFAAPLSTGFLAEAFGTGWRPAAALGAERLAVAAAAWYFDEATRHGAGRPLDGANGLRLGAPAGRPAGYTVQVGQGGEIRELALTCLGKGRMACALDGHDFQLTARPDGELDCGARRYRTRRDGDAVALWCDGQWGRWTVLSALRARAASGDAAAAEDEVRASLPGVVTALKVVPGQQVGAGEPVAVLEAMKLVHTLTAPRDGVVASLGVAPGDTVQGGTVLVRFEPRQG